MVNKKECKTCVYWKRVSAAGTASSAKCCHYLLDTGKIRPKTGEVCSAKKEQ